VKVENAKLKGWLASNGMTQKELANCIGMKEATLTRRMKDSSLWKLDEVQAIMNYTGLSLEELF